MVRGAGWLTASALALACGLVGFVSVPAAAAPPPQLSIGASSSSCVASDGGATFTPPDRGVKTTGLGSDAPAYYEIGAPSGLYAGRKPKAIMLVIHGGGWYRVGPAVLAEFGRPLANRWRAAGWQTVNVDYRPCNRSIGDVLWFMQRVRARNPLAAICATGSSAGGHLAVLLATQRKDLACAISHAGPTDLVALEHQKTFNANGVLTHAGPRDLLAMAVAAFGARPSPLVNASPRRYVGNITARLLLATGATDPLVPRAQDAAFARALRAARPGAHVVVRSLPPGPSWFVHTRVSQRSLKALRAQEDALVAPLVANVSAKKMGISRS